jgi:hypothetical protein
MMVVIPGSPARWASPKGGQRRSRAGPFSSFYLRLTEIGPGGNHWLRSVCGMTAQLPPASGHSGDDFPRPRPASRSTLISDVGRGVGVQPGESDPARMLSGVLVLVVATITMALMLAWWLA